MKCDRSHEKLIAYLYDELRPEDRDELKKHIGKCASCRKELETLGATRSVLQAWPDEEPELNLRFVAEPAGFLNRLRPRGNRARKAAFGFALGVAGALLFLSFINFEASYSNEGFSVKMSLIPQTEDSVGMSPAPELETVTREEFLAWQQESLQLTSRLLEDLKVQQQRQHAALMADFAAEFEYQRRQDLRFLGRGLESFQLSNENRFRQTGEVLNHLIQASYTHAVDENDEPNNQRRE